MGPLSRWAVNRPWRALGVWLLMALTIGALAARFGGSYNDSFEPPDTESDERPPVAEADSFEDGLLDWPHYTRPAVARGHEVPEVLLSGDHGRIRRWRRREALRATRARRPDLLAATRLNAEDETLLRELDDRSGEASPLDKTPAVLHK